MMLGRKYQALELSKIIGDTKSKVHFNSYITNVSIDSRSSINDNHTLFFAIRGKRFDGHDYILNAIQKNVINIVVDRPIQGLEGVNQFVVEDTVKALQRFAAFHRKQFNIPVIAITGSNGKTIVKEWLYFILKHKFKIIRSPKSYNSQVGVPLSVLQLSEEHDLAIFEAGISKESEMCHLQEIIQPTIGVFTNLGEEHQENFISKEAKLSEKLNLFKNADLMVYKMDLFHSINELEANILFDLHQVNKPSIYDLNKQTCLGVLKALKLDSSDFEEELDTLPELAMRMRKSIGLNGNIIVKDAYSTQLDSFVSAFDYISSIIEDKQSVLIFSSSKENYTSDFLSALNELISNFKFNKVILIGENLISLEGIHYKSFDDFYINSKLNEFSNSCLLIKGDRQSTVENIYNLLVEKKHTTTLEINLDHILSNYHYFKSRLHKETKTMVMIKAFGYGAGSVEIAKLLEGQKVDYFAVAYSDEGVELRNQGITTPIMVMNPEKSSFKEMIHYRLEPEIYSETLLDDFVTELIYEGQKEYPIHIKIDTGMHRLGFVGEEISHLINTVKAQPEVKIVSVFTHLSSADNNAEKQFTLAQINDFELYSQRIRTQFPYPILFHVLNSSGIINYNEYQMNMVRLGVGLYGIGNEKLLNVTSFYTSISQIKNIKKGQSIGYSRMEIAQKDMKIATVPVGYADGLKRLAGNRNYSMLINGKKAPIVGNVCMDMCMIDVTNIRVKEGDRVEVFGDNNSIYELARVMQTIPYEILTSISRRVKRIYLKD